MRPDGAGTDERISPEERRRQLKPTDSLERDVLKVAVVFAVLSLIVWGWFYLSKRATLPDMSGANSAVQAP